MRISISLTLSLLILFACKSKQGLTIIPENEIEFSINKGGCFGTCPIYQMDIYGGGIAKFKGEKHTEKLGHYAKELGEVEYNALRERVAVLDVRRFENVYESNIPDLPLVVVACRDGKGLKSIKGKEERPQEVMDLQTILETIAESEGWIFVMDLDGTTAEEKKNYIKSEIIIEPAHGTQLPPFFNEMKQRYEMRIIDRISASSNLWLVTYNTNRISGEDLLLVLEDDRRIKSAEFNKKVKARN